MKTLRIGIIGTGRWARIHAQAYSRMPEARIFGIADINVKKAQAFAKEVKAEYYYDNFVELLHNPEIDAVSIVVPPKYFSQLIVEAAYNGKHVLCEKPLALTYEEAANIYSVIERKGVKLQVGFDRRFNPLMVALKRICEERKFGETKIVISRRYGNYLTYYDISSWRFDYEEGGGVLCSLCVHDFDLITWITGHNIAELMIVGGPLFYGGNAEDYCLATLSLSNGSLASVEGCMKPIQSNSSLEIIFRDARIEADIANSQLKIHQNGHTKVKQMQKILTVDHSVRAFLDSIINDTTTCTTKEEMLATVKVLEVARKIIRSSFQSDKKIAIGFHSFRK